MIDNLSGKAAASGKDRQFVTALARGLKVLRCFTHDRATLSCSEIARRVGLPQPSVWRLCHTLIKEGYLVIDGNSGKMSVGLPALSLGYSALAHQPLAEIALPYMRAMTARTRLGLVLTTRDGPDVVYLQRTHGDFTYINDPIGARRPFALAPSGWACYALFDNAEREEVKALIKAAFPEKWTDIVANLDRGVEEYRRWGFVLSIGVLHGQYNAVAVPVRTHGTGRIYGLSASGVAADWPVEKLKGVGSELVTLGRDLAAAQA